LAREISGAAAVRRALREQARPQHVAGALRFFKCGPGEYGEGDRFLGVTVPAQRRVARRFRDLSLDEADALLQSPFHEERLTALFILVDQFTRAHNVRTRRNHRVGADLQVGPERVRKQIFTLYMKRLRFINNWDLVDSSAAQIVGGWLADKPASSAAGGRELLDRLARSPHLWSRRVAMIATFYFIYRGEHRDAIRIATRLVHDEHDLIHKAVGWMLREVGKRASPEALTTFLSRHAATMPRTMLRYAIERLPLAERRRWMNMAGQRQERNKIRHS
jgi:3-methyladenine DNA glycosylase AlkD